MLYEVYNTRAIYEERLREAEEERLAYRFRRAQADRRVPLLARWQVRVADGLIALGHRMKPKGELAYGGSVR